MADYSTRWKAEIVLEYTVPFGSHVDEIGKALSNMTREVAQHGGGDVFIEHDDDNLVFRATISSNTYPSRPNYQVTRADVPRNEGVSTVRSPGEPAGPLLPHNAEIV